MPTERGAGYSVVCRLSDGERHRSGAPRWCYFIDSTVFSIFVIVIDTDNIVCHGIIAFSLKPEKNYV